jgi:hypothetical protein
VQWALTHLSGTTCRGGDFSAYAVLPPREYLLLESLIYAVSLRNKVAVHELTSCDMTSSHTLFVPAFMTDKFTCRTLVACASHRLREKVEAGLKATAPIRKSIVHTAPHHDDIMLSYHAAMHYMLGRTSAVKQPGNSFISTNNRSRNNSFDKSSMVSGLGEVYNENVNHFAYLTSGFHSVNSTFLMQQCLAVNEIVEGKDVTFLEHAVMSGELTRDYDDLMSQFRDAFIIRDYKQQDSIEHIIFLRKVAEVYNVQVYQSYNTLCQSLKTHVSWILNEYLKKSSSGDSIPKYVFVISILYLCDAMLVTHSCMQRYSNAQRVHARNGSRSCVGFVTYAYESRPSSPIQVIILS